ncbi:TPA: hypothetical protein ACH3X1_006934 [Trebouxia sp. C0004]
MPWPDFTPSIERFQNARDFVHEPCRVRLQLRDQPNISGPYLRHLHLHVSTRERLEPKAALHTRQMKACTVAWRWVWLMLLFDWVHGKSIGDVLKAGDSAISTGQYTSAVGLYSNAIRQDNASAVLFLKRAAAYVNLAQLGLALKDMGTAIELDSKHLQGYLHRGRLLRSTCDFAAAENDFERILELKATHKGAAKEMGLLQQGRQALEQAVANKGTVAASKTRAALAAVFDVAPNCVDAKLLQAELMLDDKDYGGVVAMMGILLKGQPSNVQALYLRGKSYFYMDDQSMAKRHFGEALKYDPEHKEAKAEFSKVRTLYKKKAQAEEAEGKQDWANAERLYAEATFMDTAATLINTALWLGLCRTRWHLQLSEASVEACDQTLSLHPDNVEAVKYKARALLQNDQLDLALQTAKQAFEQQRTQELQQLVQEIEKAQKMAARKDYYKILAVTQSSHEREIKQAYREMAKKYHPDKAESQGLSVPQAEAKFTDIAEAYEVLSDYEKRAAYDRGDDIEVQQGSGGFGQGFPGGFGQRTQFNFHFG